MRRTIDFGIDLGTSNSAIAVQTGAKPTLLPAADGSVLLPSAIRVRVEGTMDIGAEAHAARFTDPANTAVEFKRQMGTGEKVHFPASDRVCTPIELSAVILRELAKRAEAHDGTKLRAAVITVPAMFQLSQCEATRQAAAAAGIEHAPLLQEPIAAAMAHAGAGYAQEGHWLVYDLGGGTFDVSLVRSRAGRLQVLDHDGDNHLGGKDFNRVLARWAADEIRSEGLLGEFRRTDPVLADAFARLNAEAERVRIRLSEVEQEPFNLADLGRGTSAESVGIHRAVDRSLIESLISPAILRTTALCKTLLKRNRITSTELKGVVLVGGPTRTPCLTAILERELGLPVKHMVDPTTIVAAGAALFAATQKLPVNLQVAATGDSGTLDLEYESMTTNPRPLLVGKVRTSTGTAGLNIRVRREDGQYDSGAVALKDQGAFAVPLALRKNELNLFEVAVLRGDETLPIGGRFSILHGLSVAKPPLSQSVGVMLADNSVCWYLRKGVVLPAANKVTHTTTVKLPRGAAGDAIKVPLVQGESDRADRNKVIGVLCIHAEGIARDLPAGTEVEITLTVDEFSRTSAKGFVPLLNQWFDQVVSFSDEGKDAGAVSTGLDEQRERLRQLQLEADQLDADGGENIDSRIGEVESLLSEGDRDSVELADQMVRLMTRQIDRVESGARVDKLKSDFDEQVLQGRGLITAPEERRQLESLREEFETALARGDVAVAQTKYDAVYDLVFRASMSHISFWKGMLGWLYHKFESLNMLKVAEEQFKEGVAASQNEDFGSLRRVCLDLYGMLPRDERAAFGGGALTSSVM